MERKLRPPFDYRSMAILAVVVGVLAIALQLVPGFELISFMLGAVALGGLLSRDATRDEQATERLANSYKTAFEALFLIVMAAYAILEVATWLGFQGVSAALSTRWPVLILAIMCLVMGLAGLRAGRGLQRSA